VIITSSTHLFSHSICQLHRPGQAMSPHLPRWVWLSHTHVFSSTTATPKIQHLATETATPFPQILFDNGEAYSITEWFSPTIFANLSVLDKSPPPPKMGAVVRETYVFQAQWQLQHRKTHNRQLIQPLQRTPYTSVSIQELQVPRTHCFSVHTTNKADEGRNSPVQHLNSTRCC